MKKLPESTWREIRTAYASELGLRGRRHLERVVRVRMPENYMRRGPFNARGWDAAIRAVQKAMLELAASVPLSDEQDRILTAAFLRCEDLTARRYRARFATNAELAVKYGISARTVTNWRREGCPFERGQWRVLGWIARRRYAPERTRAKFGERLRHRQNRAILKGRLAPMRAEILNLKALHRANGVPMDDWLRGMPFRAR